MLKVFVLLSLIAGAHLIVLPPYLRRTTTVATTSTDGGIDVAPDQVEDGKVTINSFGGLLGGFGGLRELAALRGGFKGIEGFGGPIRVDENLIKNIDAGIVRDVPSEYEAPEEEKPHSEYGVPKALPAIEATTAQ